MVELAWPVPSFDILEKRSNSLGSLARDQLGTLVMSDTLLIQATLRRVEEVRRREGRMEEVLQYQRVRKHHLPS